MIRVTVLFYSVAMLAGMLLAHWRGTPAFDPWRTPAIEAWWVGFFVVLVVHLSTRLLLPRWELMRQAAMDLRGIFGSLRRRDALVIAIASGLGEEWFFRGWLLNEIGWIPSSLIFGFIHWPWRREWWPWPLFATAMGFVLGWFCLHYGGIWVAVLVHAAINYLNLRVLTHFQDHITTRWSSPPGRPSSGT